MKDISIDSNDKDRKSSLIGLKNEFTRIQKYETPYRVYKGIERIRYQNKNGEEVVFTITDELIKMSVTYLYSIDEYVCQKTMQETLWKMARGEITPDVVERAKKEKELRLLQKQDDHLDEAIRKICMSLGTKSY